MPSFRVLLKHMDTKTNNLIKSTNVSLLLKRFINVKSNTKIKVTQQQKKSKLKNT